MRKNHRHRYFKSSHSSDDDEMMDFGYFASSSSSNLSPLAPPFTVERSNPNKLNLSPNLDSRFNGSSDGVSFNSPWPYSQSSITTQGLLADSISTAAVPSANNHLIPDPIIPLITPNWSALNSVLKSGLEPINPPAVNPNPQPTDSFSYNHTEAVPSYYSYDAPLMPLNGHDNDAFHSTNFVQGYGSSRVDYSQSLSGLKYHPQQVGTWSGLADGSQRKNLDSGHSFFSHEANISGPFSSNSYMNQESHPLVSVPSPDPPKEPWNTHRPYTPCAKQSTTFDYGNDIKFPWVTKGVVSANSMDISNAAAFIRNEVLYDHKTHNPLKQKESHLRLDSEPKESGLTLNQLSFQIGKTDDHAKTSTDNRLNFEFKASSNLQVRNVNTTKDVKSVANSSEHLDHHNPAEDSPCWKGAPTHFSPFGSLERSSDSPRNGYGFLSEPLSDAKPQVSQLKLPNLNEDTRIQSTDENAANLLTAEVLDVNVLVKALNNLSELLLLQCLKDECGLKEQDYKALDHILVLLSKCMPKKIQQVPPAQDDQSKDRNMFQTIKKVLNENLECEEDLSSHSLLYKNLWLEAEAELCAFRYKDRFQRAKRGTDKSKAADVSEVASDVKKITISNTHNDDVENSVMDRFNILKRREELNPVNMAEKEPANVEAFSNEIQSSGVAEGPNLQQVRKGNGERYEFYMNMEREMNKCKAAVPDVTEVASDVKEVPIFNFPPTASKLMHEGAGSKTSNTHARNSSLLIDDVENSVMARFNILKCREESNPVNMEDSEVSSNEIQRSDGALWNHGRKDDAVVKPSDGNQKIEYHLPLGTDDVEHSIMARLNVLRCRGESNPVDVERKEAVVSGGGITSAQNQLESGGLYTTYSASSDWEHVLKDEFSWT